jgi:hypothetical protein
VDKYTIMGDKVAQQNPLLYAFQEYLLNGPEATFSLAYYFK